MSISSLLTSLLIPLNLCLVILTLALVAWLIRWRKTAAILLTTSLLWGLIWSLPITSIWAGGYLEHRYKVADYTAPTSAKAIVVLGGHSAGGRNNWFDPYDKATAIRRADTAAALFLAQPVPLIIVSGAALDGSMSEAQSMATALQQAGIPEEVIQLEKNSHTTYENAYYTGKILDELNIDHILLVTSALHMPRAVATFKKLGVRVSAAASPRQIWQPNSPDFSVWTPNLRAFDASRSILKEYVGLFVYWLRGWV